jgi:hypothetical protein
MRWFDKISSVNPDDQIALADKIGEFINVFDGLYDELSREAIIQKGVRVEEIAARIPGLAERNWGLYVECDAILKYIEIQIDRAQGKARKNFIEHYNRDLTSQQVEKYSAADEKVLAYRAMAIEVGLIRGKFTALSKNIEMAHFQIGNLTKLRCAGIEDATI